MRRLLSRIWPGCSGPPSSISSSPVDSTATRARGCTDTSRALTLASTPSTAGRTTVPGVNSRSPGCTSSPAARTACPGATVASIRTRVARRQPLGVLDHHHGVGTRGHRRPGHDPDRLARLQHPIGRGPGRHLGDHRHLDRHGQRCRPRAPRTRRRRCSRTAAPARRPPPRPRARAPPPRSRPTLTGARGAHAPITNDWASSSGIIRRTVPATANIPASRQTGRVTGSAHTASPADGFTASWVTVDGGQARRARRARRAPDAAVGERGVDGVVHRRARARRVRRAAVAALAAPPVPAVPRPRRTRSLAGHRRPRALGRDERRPPARARRRDRRHRRSLRRVAHRVRAHASRSDGSRSTSAARSTPGWSRSTSRRSRSNPCCAPTGDSTTATLGGRAERDGHRGPTSTSSACRSTSRAASAARRSDDSGRLERQRRQVRRAPRPPSTGRGARTRWRPRGSRPGCRCRSARSATARR